LDWDSFPVDTLSVVAARKQEAEPTVVAAEAEANSSSTSAAFDTPGQTLLQLSALVEVLKTAGLEEKANEIDKELKDIVLGTFRQTNGNWKAVQAALKLLFGQAKQNFIWKLRQAPTGLKGDQEQDEGVGGIGSFRCKAQVKRVIADAVQTEAAQSMLGFAPERGGGGGGAGAPTAGGGAAQSRAGGGAARTTESGGATNAYSMMMRRMGMSNQESAAPNARQVFREKFNSKHGKTCPFKVLLGFCDPAKCNLCRRD
jgi:hypothetical protein